MRFRSCGGLSRSRAQMLTLLLLFFTAGRTALAAVTEIPRVILALYDGREGKEIAYSTTHQIVEMPLNHLGLVVSYHDINQGLPPIHELQGVRGILTWFQTDAMANPQAFLSWAEAAVNAGKRFVILGNFAVSQDLQKHMTPLSAINRFLAKLGLRTEGDWQLVTYDMKIAYKDPLMVEFERRMDGPLPPYTQVVKTDGPAKSYLTIRRSGNPQTDSHLVVVGPKGCYVAAEYTHYSDAKSNRLEWYINPFEFFRLAFGTDDLPKPDPNTLSGRRIFYSHVDGDGWRNLTEIDRYRKPQVLSAEVIRKEVVEAFPDLPVTVAPIVADLDPNWAGTPESLRLAKIILSAPNVEAGSHTYSHPLDWNFFAAGGTGEPRGSLRSVLAKIFAGPEAAAEGGSPATPGSSKKPYRTPRSYDSRPFSLSQEIEGSIAFLNNLLPPGKKVQVLQWSGDTRPFEAAIAATRAAGVRNINGGDTRLDREFPSYAWVAPLGRPVGAQRQIYASSSNETTYTDLWKGQFFGFQHLARTLHNTETPMRVKPFNVYYHMYSGQKLSSLNAVVENLRYARAQEITPIATSNYAAIADGFYTTQIVSLGPKRWRIENRGALQTIRFDHGTFQAVDFVRSKGVIGQRHYQGSLYVALDRAEQLPVITLRDHFASDKMPPAAQPYLIQARFPVWDLRSRGDQFSFRAQGYGRGDMVWKVPQAGLFEVQVRNVKTLENRLQARASVDGILAFVIGSGVPEPLQVTITRRSGTP